MVKLYLKKIADGTITIEDVPKMWRAKVEAELAKREAEEDAKNLPIEPVTPPTEPEVPNTSSDPE